MAYREPAGFEIAETSRTSLGRIRSFFRRVTVLVVGLGSSGWSNCYICRKRRRHWNLIDLRGRGGPYIMICQENQDKQPREMWCTSRAQNLRWE